MQNNNKNPFRRAFRLQAVLIRAPRNIDVVDAESKKLVWEGSIVGRVRDSDVRNLEATIDEAGAAAMAGFPVASPGAGG